MGFVLLLAVASQGVFRTLRFIPFFENLLIALFCADYKKIVCLCTILLSHHAAFFHLVSNVLPCQLFRRLSANFSEFRQYHQESKWCSPVLFNREASPTRTTRTSCHAIPQELPKTVSLLCQNHSHDRFRTQPQRAETAPGATLDWNESPPCLRAAQTSLGS